MLAVYEVINHATLDRPGTIERVERGEIFQHVGLILAKHVAHPT